MGPSHPGGQGIFTKQIRAIISASTWYFGRRDLLLPGPLHPATATGAVWGSFQAPTVFPILLRPRRGLIAEELVEGSLRLSHNGDGRRGDWRSRGLWSEVRCTGPYLRITDKICFSYGRGVQRGWCRRRKCSCGFEEKLRGVQQPNTCRPQRSLQRAEGKIRGAWELVQKLSWLTLGQACLCLQESQSQSQRSPLQPP